MRNTPRNPVLRELSKDKNIEFHSVTYDITYKGIRYECKYNNSFNVSYSLYISTGGKQVKHFEVHSAPSVKLSIELIQEYLSK